MIPKHNPRRATILRAKRQNQSASANASKKAKMNRDRTFVLRPHVTQLNQPKSGLEAKKRRDTSLNSRIASDLPNLPRVLATDILEVPCSQAKLARRSILDLHIPKRARRKYVKATIDAEQPIVAHKKLAKLMDDKAQSSEVLMRFSGTFARDRHGGGHTYITPVETRDGRSVRIPANLAQPRSDRNSLPNKFTDDKAAFDFVNGETGVHTFKTLGRVKMSSNKIYRGKLLTFCEFLQRFKPFKQITTIDRLTIAIEYSPQETAEIFRKYIVFRFITGKAVSTVAGDISAMLAFWESVHTKPMQEWVPDLIPVFQAGKRSYGEIQKGTDTLQPEELRNFFNNEETFHCTLKEGSTNYKRHKLHFYSWKLAYLFALRPSEMYSLRKQDVVETHEILDFQKETPVIHLYLRNAKTVKNQYQYEIATRPVCWMQHNISALLKQIRQLSCPNSTAFFAVKGKPLTYDKGRNIFNQAIARWVRRNPQYRQKHYTFYTIRSSALCNAYKYNTEKLSTIKHLARHKQSSRVTTRNYLSKDKTLRWNRRQD